MHRELEVMPLAFPAHRYLTGCRTAPTLRPQPESWLQEA